MRTVSLLLVAAAVTGCTTSEPMARTAKAEAHLDQLLAGREAGPAVDCVSTFRADDMITIDDNTVVFKEGSKLYRNDFQDSSCSGLGSGHYALVTRQYNGTRLCRGDIAKVQDVSNGTVVGSCVLGDFVPYTIASR
jgi:hypothetical protein